ncbi:MAG: DUF5615 family PIN-like protein [Gemmatimonadales bacterium]
MRLTLRAIGSFRSRPESGPIQLDENIPAVVADLLGTAGHSVETAQTEELAGSPDEQLLQRGVSENRVLVTLDKDFADIRRHQPEQTPGIVVFRPRVPSPTLLAALIRKLIPLLETEEVQGRLWVVDEHRVRIWPST